MRTRAFLKPYALLLCAALVLGSWVFAGPAVAQSSPTAAQSGAHDMEIPTAGMGATTEGSRVILHSDGTWELNRFVDTSRVTAVTDHGRTVELSETTADDGTKTKVWKVTGTGGGGPIQVVVTRAVTTDLSIHSSRDNCIPVIKVRNLTKVSLHRIVVEIDFHTEGGAHGGTSLMFGPLPDGVEREEVSAPLFVPACKGLKGHARVPYCVFKDGVRCESIVIASDWGVIPLSMAAQSDEELENTN